MNVLITGDAKAHLDEIRFTFDEISMRLGIPIQLCTELTSETAHLVYGIPADGVNAAWIPFDVCCYKPESPFTNYGNPVLWAASGARNREEIDLVGGMFRLLALLDESQVSEGSRDKRGIFPVNALPQARRNTLAEPLVENHVAAIREVIQRHQVLPAALEKWPNGYKWVVLLTHDTDALNLAAVPELLFNASKLLLRRDRVRYRMVRDGLRFRRQPVENNPLFGFAGWRKFSEKTSVPNAFYLYLRRKVRPTLNDCRSSVGDRRFNWKILKAMADSGSEFGLHPPISAKNDIDEFVESKRFIEDRLETPVFGLRHHYWALDWRKPHLTYRKHVNAGFRYDLSMAWRDAAGFRTGSCLPHRPWDPGRKRGLDLYSVPTAVMDGHVILDSIDLSNPVERAMSVVQGIRHHGGIATFDWHTESAVNDYCYRGHRSVMEEIMQRITERDDVWLTTPWKAVAHWHQRRRMLLESGST
jgi:hypothetical protein